MPRFWYWVNSLSPRNASALLPEEANPTFIDDAADKCYASESASGLRLPYSEHLHLGYLRDLLFGLSDSAPHLHTITLAVDLIGRSFVCLGFCEKM